MYTDSSHKNFHLCCELVKVSNRTDSTVSFLVVGSYLHKIHSILTRKVPTKGIGMVSWVPHKTSALEVSGSKPPQAAV